MNIQSGLSLLELLVALTVAGILMSIAGPSFMESRRNSEMAGAANSIVAALHAARSEAIKIQNRVTLCRADTSGTTPACSNTGDDLLVFTNIADDATFNPGAGDSIVRSDNWLRDKMTVTASTGFPPYVSFNREGFTRAIGGGSIAGTLLLCGPSEARHARVVTVSATGRPAVQKYKDSTTTLTCPST